MSSTNPQPVTWESELRLIADAYPLSMSAGAIAEIDRLRADRDKWKALYEYVTATPPERQRHGLGESA